MKHLLPIVIATSFVLAENVDLDTIVVSATKSEESIKNITSNVVVITKEELEDKHVTTVAEALKEVPGVVVVQTGGLGQPVSFYLRGFKSENTLVMIDGVKINNPTAIGGQAELAHLLVSDIERIEIIKGPQSGIYGANAVAGVINIITKKATKECSSNINLEYGKYDTKKIQASIAKRVGDLSLYLGYAKLKTDGFSARADINKDLDSFEDDGYENKTINFKASYDFTKSDTLELKYTKIDANVEYDKSLSDESGYIIEKDKIVNVAYTHKYALEDSYSKLYYTTSTFDKKDPLGWVKRFYGKNIEYGIDNKVKYNNLEVLFGFNKNKSKDLLSKKSLDSKGLYLTTIYKLNNSVFNATLRKDWYDEFKDKVTGKIGFKHTFENGLIISANYGTAYRVPTLDEMYGPWGANPNLKPQTTKGYDISLEYQNFNITYFYNTIKNEIQYTTGYINNPKKSKIKGVEISYKGALGEDLLYSLDYTRYIAKDSNGKQLLRRPNYIINASLDYYGFENTHINFNAQYIGDRVDNDYSSFPPKKVHTGHVFVANLAADYQITKDLKAYVKINNIFDKKYQEVYGYGTSGRAVYVGINAKF